MWWVPLAAAAVSMIQAQNKKRRAEKDATADTVNAIKQSHAQSIGGDPYLGMATQNAINIGRADRDYEPPMNAVGAAIQAIGSSGGGGGMGGGSGTGSLLEDEDGLIDPWKRR